MFIGKIYYKIKKLKYTDHCNRVDFQFNVDNFNRFGGFNKSSPALKRLKLVWRQVIAYIYYDIYKRYTWCPVTHKWQNQLMQYSIDRKLLKFDYIRISRGFFYSRWVYFL